MKSFVILREKTFLQEAGSFLVLLHMEMVRQITYCGQNWHAEREEGSFLPAPDQTKARMGEGQAEESMNIHTQSQPLLCLDNRDTEKYKEERGYPQSSFWHQFLASTWLWHLLQHLPCTCSPSSRAVLAWQAESCVLLQGLVGYRSWGDGETSACLAESCKVWSLKWWILSGLQSA